MARKAADLTGRRFGRAIAVEYLGSRKWKCVCDCGNTFVTYSNHLTLGETNSCGCLARERASKRLKTHGQSYTRIYHIWRGIKDRCLNEKTHDFERYGGRGITICDEWKDDFLSFRTWALSNGYKEDLSIDRKNNNEGYSPENCRWTTLTEQGRNKSNNRIISFNGENKTLSEWSEITGISFDTLWHRLGRGWSVEKTFTTPL